MKSIYRTLSLLLAGACLGAVLSHYWQKGGASEASGLHPMQSFANCSTDDQSTAYVCSMHPQMHRADPGHCPACGMKMIEKQLLPQNQSDLVQLSKGEALLAHVQTVPVGRSKGTARTIPIAGLLQAQEDRVREQVAGLPGRIEAFYVKSTGTYVQRGQAIASIYSKDLIAAVEILKQGNTSESIMRSARNNIKGWNLDLNIIEAFDYEGGDYHKPVTLKADYSGYVLERMVKQGSYTANGYMSLPTVLYTVADLSELWGVFEVYESDLAWVKKGQQVHFTVESYPNQVFSGQVSFISPVIAPSTKTVSIRLDISNPDGRLKPGMLAEANLQAQLEEKGLVVPKSAVLWTGKRSLVYVRDTNYSTPVFHAREVLLGSMTDTHYSIEQGLDFGEHVVAHGAFALDAAAQLQGKRSMMNRTGSAANTASGSSYSHSWAENAQSPR